MASSAIRPLADAAARSGDDECDVGNEASLVNEAKRAWPKNMLPRSANSKCGTTHREVRTHGQSLWARANIHGLVFVGRDKQISMDAIPSQQEAFRESLPGIAMYGRR